MGMGSPYFVIALGMCSASSSDRSWLDSKVVALTVEFSVKEALERLAKDTGQSKGNDTTLGGLGRWVLETLWRDL